MPSLARFTPKVPAIYRYATRKDWFIIVVSAISAMAAGAALPLMTVVFGNLSGSFGGYTTDPTAAFNEFTTNIDQLTLYLVYIAIGEYVTIYIATVGFIYTGNRIACQFREQYLRAVLRQDMTYFDACGASVISTLISVHTYLVQDGISQKVALALTSIATFVGAFIVGFVKYWKLTLILTSAIVAIATTTAGLSLLIVKYFKGALTAYSSGGAVVEEALGAMRNTTAFGTQDKLAKMYDAHLVEAEKAGFKSKAATGSLMGIMMGYIFLTYALAFWLGGRYLLDGELSLSSFLTITQAIIIGAFALGGIVPNIQSFNTAFAAANALYATIDRVSPLDPESEEGDRPSSVEGVIELSHVTHVYPTRPDVVVMEDVSLKIPAGKTTAIVGASGSGKSTIIALLERFYDPAVGDVLLDGRNIKTLNLRWLRRQFSVVAQEPVLFGTSIAENIGHGLIGTEREDLSETEKRVLIEEAARVANAHEFISQFPQGYDTQVGERGVLLSGGQKQRIAIARAVVRDPKVLLLDEATSALDTRSEGVVQAALDRASQGRATIVIAHRLSTIKNADNIVVMSSGRIVEQGSHNELVAKEGVYHGLVKAQEMVQRQEQEHESEDWVERDSSEREADATDEKIDAPASTSDLEMGKTGVASSEGHLDAAIVNEKGSPDTSSPTSKPASSDPQNYSFWTLVKLVAGFNKPEWRYMLLGLFAAIITGGGQPTQSVFYAEALSALSLFPYDSNNLGSTVSFWSWMYFMLALVQLIFSLIQGVAFAFCSERLVRRTRALTFRHLLGQDLQFFDRSENSPGALAAFLNTETTNLAGISGVTLGTLIQVTVTLTACYIISLAIGWKLALVCMSTVPVLLGCGFLRVWLLARFQKGQNTAAQMSAAYASEAAGAVRTVAMLTREQDVLKRYHDMLVTQSETFVMSTLKTSTLYAASQSFILLCMALALWYGSQLIANREYSEFQFFLCYSAVIFGSQSAGTAISFAPDVLKSRQAATQLKRLFDSQCVINSTTSEGDSLPKLEGSVEFRDVHFSYPTRPDVAVLRGINLKVKPGTHVALVGASGCGKSTVIGLVERFYDPLSGGIFVDGQDVRSLNVKAYRKHLALVSQEPTLYQGTIRENILLGLSDGVPDASDAEIEQACRSANIYDFITSLPDGFNTVVGSKGGLLSGGQKQRIAVARALLRDPRILILDEATSALDSESEKVVQAALDAAAKGRTTISIAHRLSTIQNADLIYVFDRGQVVEHGTHASLLAKKGLYFDLVNLQSLSQNA